LAFRIVAVQGALAAILTMMFLMSGRANAVSALVAGVVVIAPSFGFAWSVARRRVSPGNELSAARRLLAGGVAKLLATVSLLVVVFVYAHPEPVAFFVTMITMQVAYWFAPMLNPDA
jgi:ATP synthase protein I